MVLYLKVTNYSREDINPRQDIVLRGNNDQIIECYFLDQYEDALNIQGATVYFTLKNNPTDDDAHAVLSKSFADSTFPNPLSGDVAITLTQAETVGLLGTYFYSIDIKLSDGTKKVASEGIATFQKELRTTF